MNPDADPKNPAVDEVEPRRPKPFDPPHGPDDTAEPDGQFPDDNPDVGTIKAPPEEEPVPVKDPPAVPPRSGNNAGH